MSEAGSRSAFLPSCFVGGAFLLSVAAFFLIPCLDCDRCYGLGRMTWGELAEVRGGRPFLYRDLSEAHPNPREVFEECSRCSGSGSITLDQTLFGNPAPDSLPCIFWSTSEEELRKVKGRRTP